MSEVFFGAGVGTDASFIDGQRRSTGVGSVSLYTSGLVVWQWSMTFANLGLPGPQAVRAFDSLNLTLGRRWKLVLPRGAELRYFIVEGVFAHLDAGGNVPRPPLKQIRSETQIRGGGVDAVFEDIFTKHVVDGSEVYVATPVRAAVAGDNGVTFLESGAFLDIEGEWLRGERIQSAGWSTVWVAVIPDPDAAEVIAPPPGTLMPHAGTMTLATVRDIGGLAYDLRLSATRDLSDLDEDAAAQLGAIWDACGEFLDYTYERAPVRVRASACTGMVGWLYDRGLTVGAVGVEVVRASGWFEALKGYSLRHGVIV